MDQKLCTLPEHIILPPSMMLLSFNSNTTGDTSGSGTVQPSGKPGFSGVFVAQSTVFFVVLCYLLGFSLFFYGF